MDLDYVRHHVSRSEMPPVPDERRRVQPPWCYVGAEEHSWRVLAFHRGQLPHCEADATFHARHGRPAVHEAWLCLQCAPPDERHAGTRYP